MELDWHVFESEWAQFMEYAFEPKSSTREWKAWECERTADKIRMNLRVLLARLAGQTRGWQPSLAWLCNDCIEIFKSHEAYLASERGNKPSAIAQTMRTFKRPLNWAMNTLAALQGPERVTAMRSYDTFCSNLASIGFRDHQVRSETRKARECESAEETWQHTTTVLGTTTNDLLTDYRASPASFQKAQEKCVQLLQVFSLQLSIRAPRGLEIFKAHYAADLKSATYLMEEELLPKGATVMYAAASGGYRLLVPSIKGRMNHVDLTAACSELMGAVQYCFDLQCGDYIFTPSLHGTRAISQGSQDQFDAAKWSNFIGNTTQQLLSTQLRPRELRRLRATHIASKPTMSPAVLQSVAVSMGTSSKQLLNVYNSNSTLQKTQLSQQIELFESDRRFGGDSQTVVVPTQSAHGITFAPARYVRGEGASSALFAIFEMGAGTVEMGTDLIRCNPALLNTSCRLVDDQHTGKQLWRSRSFTTAHAQAKFSSLGTRLQSWVTNSRVGAPVAGAVQLVIGDIVYAYRECAIGQVKQVSSNGQTVTVEIATELPGTTSNRATYQFLGYRALLEINVTEVAWPIDLQFAVETGSFTLRKSCQLETV